MNRRRRTQPKATIELETVALRLPSHLVRVVDQYARYLSGCTDRTLVVTRALEIALAQDADFQKTLTTTPATPSVDPVRATA